jgi:large subunit ribosomal protein L29
MKITELREQTIEELNVRRRELKEEAVNLRMQQQSSQLENPARIRSVRRELARIETILTDRRNTATTGAN